MYDTGNDIPGATREKLIERLNALLAPAIDLKLQAKQAHWNVKGPNFVGLHELFDRVADAADEYADLIAERGVALGGIAEGTLQTVAKRTPLREYPPVIHEWTEHVEALRHALATFAKDSRAAIDETAALKDADTSDVLTEISRGLDKLLWMVEAHVQVYQGKAR
jgi:starvation-inducible DNA-binding protein